MNWRMRAFYFPFCDGTTNFMVKRKSSLKCEKRNLKNDFLEKMDLQKLMVFNKKRNKNLKYSLWVTLIFENVKKNSMEAILHEIFVGLEQSDHVNQDNKLFLAKDLNQFQNELRQGASSSSVLEDTSLPNEFSPLEGYSILCKYYYLLESETKLNTQLAVHIWKSLCLYCLSTWKNLFSKIK
jgi:hypothetical protein